MIELEILHEGNLEIISQIDRSDISEDILDTIEEIGKLTLYAIKHHLKGHTFVIQYQNKPVGFILMGEGIPWAVDPIEVKDIPFYRIMGFVIDKEYRNLGIGSAALEKVIQLIYQEFGPRPIVLGCQEENIKAMNFYMKHDFIQTNAKDEDDCFFIRYPKYDAV